MLVQKGDRAAKKPSGILDSPILARVERVLLRHEEGLKRDSGHLQRAAYTQSLLSSNYGKDATHAIKRGLLWQQRDKLFSRWKERYFILTRDYLHCFQRASGADRISEMGQFLFKIKLADVERVEWENKRTYSTVVLLLGRRDGKIYLRASDGLEDWFELVEECMITSKERRHALRYSHDGRRENTSLNEWLATHQRLPMRQLPVESVKQDPKQRDWTPSESNWENPTLDNRLSRYTRKINKQKRWRCHPFSKKLPKILTDIDINSYDDSTLGAPSITSYRLNQDVLCIQPPSLRSSFRSTREPLSPPKRNVVNVQDMQYIKFRERSYSDIPRDDRRLWRGLPLQGESRFQH